MTDIACPTFPRAARSNAGEVAGSDLCQLPATRIAELVRTGQLSALEAVEAHIARIEEVNPGLNAVVVKRYDAARAEARQIDRRRAAGEALPLLAGIPVTVKECLDLAGTASTFGLPSRVGALAAADDVHVARLRQAGAIVLGKTNVSQLLIYVESDNPLYGRTNNPWNGARIAGGSSGGEGAIIAVGGSPLGLGTDIGGSLRYPSAFCGVASVKPTAGRCPDLGRFSVPIGQREIASQVGVLARTVDDVALGLSAINGNGLDRPAVPLGDMGAVDIGRLRIGVYTDDGVMPSSPAVRRAVEEAAAILGDAGATIIEWAPLDPAEAFHLAFAIFSADGGALMKAMLGRDRVHPSVKSLLGIAGLSQGTLRVLRTVLRTFGQSTLADLTRHFGFTRTVDYWRLTEQLMSYRQRFAAAMDKASGGPIDLILGPACALPAFPHGATKDLGLGGANAVLYNVLGLPAGVVPVTRVRQDEEGTRSKSLDVVLRAARTCDIGSAGLPVGVQIAARPWREHVALAAMRIVERSASQKDGFPVGTAM